MDKLKEKFLKKAVTEAEVVKQFIAQHGEEKLGEYNVAQVYQGMRGMVGLITETSKLDPEEGIRFRGYTIPELREKLPKAPNGSEPLPEGIFYLMLIGELPTQDDVNDITNNWARRSIVPRHVFDTLDSLPANTHPMTEFSIGVMAMQTESLFAAAYKKGMSKK
ncbi:MAG TPA: citrate/2-methylcitrate synthase, partial [Bacteroidia bacterium]|nr:citrate/2-methylcitrate synthase [Bacteroidia bacterium]